MLDRNSELITSVPSRPLTGLILPPARCEFSTEVRRGFGCALVNDFFYSSLVEVRFSLERGSGSREVRVC